MWREVVGAKGSYELQECADVYGGDFPLEDENLRHENAFLWKIS